MKHEQPALPYAMNALSPFLSEEQLFYHYSKHHAAYFANLNRLIEGKKEGTLTIRELIQTTHGPIFNNAAQAWNHNFFWLSLSPKPGQQVAGQLKGSIERHFGSFEAFKTAFSDAANTLFGSGWAWLAKSIDGKLEIMALPNGENPIKYGKEAVLGLDVWEHSYYIDYRNRRADYTQKFFEHINWEFAEDHFIKPQL